MDTAVYPQDSATAADSHYISLPGAKSPAQVKKLCCVLCIQCTLLTVHCLLYTVYCILFRMHTRPNTKALFRAHCRAGWTGYRGLSTQIWTTGPHQRSSNLCSSLNDRIEANMKLSSTKPNRSKYKVV